MPIKNVLIPPKVHGNDREILGFYTTILNYRKFLIPTGEGIRHFLATVPEGFLSCDGSAVSRTTYATLFSAIGTVYGVGDGSTTFNVPTAAGFVIKT
jgi:hypothetical protein